jgi:hypothetical protein
MERENDLVLFRNYADPLIAQFHKVLLDKHGIPSVINGLGFNMPSAFFSASNSGIKILVRNSDLKSAFDLMAEDDEDDMDLDFDTDDDLDLGEELDLDFDDDDFDDLEDDDLQFDEKELNEGFDIEDDFDEDSIFGENDPEEDFGFEEDED